MSRDMSVDSDSSYYNLNNNNLNNNYKNNLHFARKSTVHPIDNHFVVTTDQPIKEIPINGVSGDDRAPHRVTLSWHNINVFSKRSRGIPNPFSKKQDKPAVHILKNGTK